MQKKRKKWPWNVYIQNCMNNVKRQRAIYTKQRQLQWCSIPIPELFSFFLFFFFQKKHHYETLFIGCIRNSFVCFVWWPIYHLKQKEIIMKWTFTSLSLFLSFSKKASMTKFFLNWKKKFKPSQKSHCSIYCITDLTLCLLFHLNSMPACMHSFHLLNHFLGPFLIDVIHTFINWNFHAIKFLSIRTLCLLLFFAYFILFFFLPTGEL